MGDGWGGMRGGFCWGLRLMMGLGGWGWDGGWGGGVGGFLGIRGWYGEKRKREMEGGNGGELWDGWRKLKYGFSDGEIKRTKRRSPNNSRIESVKNSEWLVLLRSEYT